MNSGILILINKLKQLVLSFLLEDKGEKKEFTSLIASQLTTKLVDEELMQLRTPALL